jgi:hypothetical protein
VDGLWIGVLEGNSYRDLDRVEDALQLIKRHSAFHYSAVLRNLERVLVNVLPHGEACYQRSLGACVLDERFVLSETTRLDRIAAVIIHEATHARLERCGLHYDEKYRSRIEEICLRQELTFALKLPDSGQLQEEIKRTLEWCASDHDYFSDTNLEQRDIQGGITTLRYLGTPDWMTWAVLKLRPIIGAVRQVVRRMTLALPLRR